MARFLLAAVMALAAFQQGWGLTCAADMLDLCDYKTAECATNEMDLCNYKKMPLECSAGEFDLCDYKTSMPSPVPTQTSMPSPVPTQTSMPSPVPTPTDECATNEMDLCSYKKMPLECSAGEFDLCDYKKSMPSPVPTQSSMPSPVPSVMATAIDIELELTDVTSLGMDKLKAAMAAASQVNADKVEIGSVEYKTKVSYSMPETVEKSAVTTAIAKSCNVAESQVEVVETTSRRLSETRRLATTIQAIITTTTISEVASIVTKAKDEAQLKQAFADAGLTVEPTVEAQPKTFVAAKITLKGEAGQAAPAVPSADAIQKEVKDKAGITVVARIGQVLKVADWALSASTTMAQEEPADAAKDQNSMLWMAFTVAATLLLKAI